MSSQDIPISSGLDEELSVTRRGINVRSYGVIKSIMGSRTIDSLPLRLRCECSVETCEEIIEITLAQRRDLRRRFASSFIVVVVHADINEGAIVYKADEYAVVEKPELTQTVVDL